MTFQELAIRLNYNGPSGAEKAYKKRHPEAEKAVERLARMDSGSPFRKPFTEPKWRRRVILVTMCRRRPPGWTKMS